nr:uncharacterized protein LOC109412715 [Aedes albopictus]
MILSHFIEKMRVGKKYVLMDLIVHPDCQRPWDTVGAENKFIPAEVWKIIYRKLGDVCRKQFAERAKSEDSRCQLNQEYECRLDGKPAYALRYEFRDENARSHLNVVFNDDDQKLHRECLVVHISDATKDLLRELEEKKKLIERLQKENKKLKEMPSQSQEYTPVPVMKSGSSGSNASMEYIPTAINGKSPAYSSSYKARKIEENIKQEPDPYTPTSSQDSLPDKVAYVPSSLSTPTRSDTNLKPSNSNSLEGSTIGKRRRREKDMKLFGTDDEEEEEPPKVEPTLNRSDEDMFSPERSPLLQDIISNSTDELTGATAVGSGAKPEGTEDCKRTQLPRKTKTGVCYSGLMSSGEYTASPPASSSSSSAAKRRRKDDEEYAPTGSSSKSIEGWLKKSSRNKSDENSSKDKDQDKRRKGKKDKEKEEPPADAAVAAAAAAEVVPLQVDHEKLKEEEENMRKTIAGLEQLNKMFPEDKSLLDIPILNCHKLSADEIEATFHNHRDALRCIYDEYKNKTEIELRDSELCNFTEVISVLTDDQAYAMIRCLEQELTPKDERGMYTDFFSSTLVMEWGLRVWMDLHRFDDRIKALERIKLQEEANPMDLTPTTLNSMMGTSRIRKR